MLANVLMLALFVFLSFALLATKLWAGGLRGGCFDALGQMYRPPEWGQAYVCSLGSGLMQLQMPLFVDSLDRIEIYPTLEITSL